MTRALRLLFAAALLVLCAAPAAAQTGGFSKSQQEAIEKILRDYLMKNPEFLMEVMESYERKRELADQDKAKTAIAERRREIFNDPDAPVSGNPNGDVTIVEFFDYRCPYCKQMVEPMARLLRDDPKVRLVHKELPILGPDSLVAARAALAARAQGKYEPLSAALMKSRATLDEATVLKIAAESGLDVARLKADMEAPDIMRIVDKNRALARALNIRGTPAFIVGDKLVPGAIDAATLKKLVAEARAK